MYGVLARALTARKVNFDRDKYSADVEGTIEGSDSQTIRITKIHVRYYISAPASQRELIDRALKVHTSACPAHASVKDSIAITSSAKIADQ